MIWIAILALSFVFVSLGMLMVMVKVLTAALALALLVIAGFVVAHIWRRFAAPMLGRQKIWQPKQLVSKGE